MKRTFAVLAITLSVIYLSTSGCVKGSDPTDPGNTISGIVPNIASFEIAAAATFIKGAATLINIASTTLVDDNYTVNYSLTGSNSYTGTASMHFSGGQGTFNTEVLTNGGNTSIVINSITSSTGNTTNVSSNNTSSFFDSSGTMHLNQQIGDPFYATDVLASINGSTLDIHGVMWEPDLRTVTLHLNNFNTSGLPKTITISSLFDGSIDLNSSSLKHAAHGTITIQSIQNSVIQGSYNGTWEDSSTFSGDYKGKLD